MKINRKKIKLQISFFLLLFLLSLNIILQSNVTKPNTAFYCLNKNG